MFFFQRQAAKMQGNARIKSLALRFLASLRPGVENFDVHVRTF